MDSTKNVRRIISFKKFGMVRVKLIQNKLAKKNYELKAQIVIHASLFV